MDFQDSPVQSKGTGKAPKAGGASDGNKRNANIMSGGKVDPRSKLYQRSVAGRESLADYLQKLWNDGTDEADVFMAGVKSLMSRGHGYVGAYLDSKNPGRVYKENEAMAITDAVMSKAGIGEHPGNRLTRAKDDEGKEERKVSNQLRGMTAPKLERGQKAMPVGQQRKQGIKRPTGPALPETKYTKDEEGKLLPKSQRDAIGKRGLGKPSPYQQPVAKPDGEGSVNVERRWQENLKRRLAEIAKQESEGKITPEQAQSLVRQANKEQVQAGKEERKRAVEGDAKVKQRRADQKRDRQDTAAPGGGAKKEEFRPTADANTIREEFKKLYGERARKLGRTLKDHVKRMSGTGAFVTDVQDIIGELEKKFNVDPGEFRKAVGSSFGINLDNHPGWDSSIKSSGQEREGDAPSEGGNANPEEIVKRFLDNYADYILDPDSERRTMKGIKVRISEIARENGISPQEVIASIRADERGNRILERHGFGASSLVRKNKPQPEEEAAPEEQVPPSGDEPQQDAPEEVSTAKKAVKEAAAAASSPEESKKYPMDKTGQFRLDLGRRDAKTRIAQGAADRRAQKEEAQRVETEKEAQKAQRARERAGKKEATQPSLLTPKLKARKFPVPEETKPQPEPIPDPWEGEPTGPAKDVTQDQAPSQQQTPTRALPPARSPRPVSSKGGLRVRNQPTRKSGGEGFGGASKPNPKAVKEVMDVAKEGPSLEDFKTFLYNKQGDLFGKTGFETGSADTNPLEGGSTQPFPEGPGETAPSSQLPGGGGSTPRSVARGQEGQQSLFKMKGGQETMEPRSDLKKGSKPKPTPKQPAPKKRTQAESQQISKMGSEALADLQTRNRLAEDMTRRISNSPIAKDEEMRDWINNDLERLLKSFTPAEKTEDPWEQDGPEPTGIPEPEAPAQQPQRALPGQTGPKGLLPPGKEPAAPKQGGKAPSGKRTRAEGAAKPSGRRTKAQGDEIRRRGQEVLDEIQSDARKGREVQERMANSPAGTGEAPSNPREAEITKRGEDVLRGMKMDELMEQPGMTSRRAANILARGGYSKRNPLDKAAGAVLDGMDRNDAAVSKAPKAVQRIAPRFNKKKGITNSAEYQEFAQSIRAMMR